MTARHDDRHDRLRRIAAQLADARSRAADAARMGDQDGARYARAEAARYRAALEG